MSMLSLCACGDSEEKDAFNGTWKFCGIIEEGNNETVENAVMEDEYLELFGLSEMQDSELRIDDNGIVARFTDSELTKRETINESCFTQTQIIKKIDDKKLENP